MTGTYDRKVYFPDEPIRADDNELTYTPQPAKVQRWKTDPNLHSCERDQEAYQSKKKLDYHQVYVKEFLNTDPIRDWESIDRCIELWMFLLSQNKIDILTVQKEKWNVLDCGTKDGQFPEWLQTQGVEALGTEISPDYVRWALEHKRPVMFGDVCALPPKWIDMFTVVFSHHLLGLVPDYWLGLSEMYRVTKPGGYMITLNDVPGNARKHFSYIEGPKIFEEFTNTNKCDSIYSGPWNTSRPKEWVYIVRKENK